MPMTVVYAPLSIQAPFQSLPLLLKFKLCLNTIFTLLSVGTDSKLILEVLPSPFKDLPNLHLILFHRCLVIYWQYSLHVRTEEI